jgi:hypothetical protein
METARQHCIRKQNSEQIIAQPIKCTCTHIPGRIFPSSILSATTEKEALSAQTSRSSDEEKGNEQRDRCSKAVTTFIEKDRDNEVSFYLTQELLYVFMYLLTIECARNGMCLRSSAPA